MGQINLTTTLVFIALFSIAIISFAIDFASDNGSPITLANDTGFVNLKEDTESNMSTFQDESGSTYESIVKTNVEGEVAPSVGPFSVTLKNIVGTTTNILRVSYAKIFGSQEGFGVFITVFLSLIGLIIGLYAYKTLRGFPD